MRKTRNLIILLIALLILVGGYVYLSTRPKKTNTANTKQVELMKLDISKLKKVKLSSKDGDLQLEKSADTWKCSSKPDIKLDQSIVNDLLTSIATLTADRIVDENPKSLDDYGLATPFVTVTSTSDSGEENVFYLGNAAPGNSGYYLMRKGDSKLYLISSTDGGHLSCKLNDLRDKNVFSADSSKVSYMKIVESGQKTIEFKKSNEDTDVSQATGLASWYLLQPYGTTYETDAQKTSDMIQQLSAVKVTDFVEDNASDLSKYGLDKPSFQLEVKDDTATYDLYFGKDADGGKVYFKLGNSNNVYTVDSSALTPFKVKPFDIVNKLIFMPYISDVDKITIEHGGKTDVLTLTRTTKAAEKAGDEAQVVTTYKLNGSDVQEDKFKSYYQTLIGITADAENDKNLEQKADVNITFDMNKGSSKQVAISYCPYNQDFYAAYMGGKADFLVSKSQVQKALDGIAQLAGK